MKQLKDIKDAIISVEDGSLHIIIGDSLNKLHPNYHNRLVFETHNGGHEILIKGHKAKSERFSQTITEENKNFEFFCESLIGFKEKVDTRKKFLWKKLKFVPEKYIIHGWWMERDERVYLYKEDKWKRIEYKTNNWVFEELN